MITKGTHSIAPDIICTSVEYQIPDPISRIVCGGTWKPWDIDPKSRLDPSTFFDDRTVWHRSRYLKFEISRNGTTIGMTIFAMSSKVLHHTLRTSHIPSRHHVWSFGIELQHRPDCRQEYDMVHTPSSAKSSGAGRYLISHEYFNRSCRCNIAERLQDGSNKIGVHPTIHIGDDIGDVISPVISSGRYRMWSQKMRLEKLAYRGMIRCHGSVRLWDDNIQLLG